MTPDICLLTYDTWYVTDDMWHGGVYIFSKLVLPISYGFGLMMFWRFQDKGNEWMNYEDVCRTAWATAGLLIRLKIFSKHDSKSSLRAIII